MKVISFISTKFGDLFWFSARSNLLSFCQHLASLEIKAKFTGKHDIYSWVWVSIRLLSKSDTAESVVKIIPACL